MPDPNAPSFIPQPDPQPMQVPPISPNEPLTPVYPGPAHPHPQPIPDPGPETTPYPPIERQ